MMVSAEVPHAAFDHGGDHPAPAMPEGLSAHGDLSELPNVPLSGERKALDGVGELLQQPAPQGYGRLSSGFWVPVGRKEASGLLDSPRLLKLYFLLRDETYRARWEYAEGDLFYRGYSFESVTPHTFFFQVEAFAPALGVCDAVLMQDLKTLFIQGYLGALHFGAQVDWENGHSSIQGFGVALSELIGEYSGPYDNDDLALCAVYMAPLVGGYVRVPKEAGRVPAPMLCMIVWLYLHATFRGRQVDHGGRHYKLGRGEVAASYADLERVLGVQRRQINRWAHYALRDGLLVRIPEGRDPRWKVKLYPRRPQPWR